MPARLSLEQRNRYELTFSFESMEEVNDWKEQYQEAAVLLKEKYAPKEEVSKLPDRKVPEQARTKSVAHKAKKAGTKG